MLPYRSGVALLRVAARADRFAGHDAGFKPMKKILLLAFAITLSARCATNGRTAVTASVPPEVKAGVWYTEPAPTAVQFEAAGLRGARLWELKRIDRLHRHVTYAWALTPGDRDLDRPLRFPFEILPGDELTTVEIR